MPDSDAGLSWLPENGPDTVGRLPCLQKETADNVSGFLSLPGETSGNAGAFFARRKREGNMGWGMSFGWFSRNWKGRYYFPHGLLRLLSGEVLEFLQKMKIFPKSGLARDSKTEPFECPDCQ
jgi:hypothetical protein